MTRHDHTAFGQGTFGQIAERVARGYGTAGFLITQTLLVALWVVVNVVAISSGWDPYPFILLNLVFSLSAAYAAPLILLAQTRQADRDKHLAASAEQHRDALAQEHRDALAANTELTARIDKLTTAIHDRFLGDPETQHHDDTGFLR